LRYPAKNSSASVIGRDFQKSQQEARQKFQKEMQEDRLEQTQDKPPLKPAQVENMLVKARTRLKPLKEVKKPIADAEEFIAKYLKMPNFELEDYDPTTGTVNGEPVDLPGVHGAGKATEIIRSVNPAARTLDSIFDTVRNIVLKDRSGAAVTSQEMQRLKAEFQEGGFNTERERIGAIIRFKRALEQFEEDEIRQMPDQVQEKFLVRRNRPLKIRTPEGDIVEAPVKNIPAVLKQWRTDPEQFEILWRE
jgi:hypothetical protein